MDKADSHLKFEGTKPGTVDAHGGWWDATGDYGKHLSHLSFSTYFNPQQIPLVVYSLLKSYEQTKLRGTRISPDISRTCWMRPCSVQITCAHEGCRMDRFIAQ